MNDPNALPTPAGVLLYPELTALATLQTALAMTALALYASYPEIGDYDRRSHTLPDLDAVLALLDQIRCLEDTARSYRQHVFDHLAPENPADLDDGYLLDNDIPF